MNRALLLLTLMLTACGPQDTDSAATFADATPEFDDTTAELRQR